MGSRVATCTQLIGDILLPAIDLIIDSRRCVHTCHDEGPCTSHSCQTSGADPAVSWLYTRGQVSLTALACELLLLGQSKVCLDRDN